MTKLNVNADGLCRELRKLKTVKNVDFKGLLAGSPDSYVKFYRNLLIDDNIEIFRYLVEKGFDLTGLTDFKFMESLYKIMRDLFNIRPSINQNQFFTQSYVQKKLELSSQLVTKTRQLLNELDTKVGKKTVQTQSLMKSSLKQSGRPYSAFCDSVPGNSRKRSQTGSKIREFGDEEEEENSDEYLLELTTPIEINKQNKSSNKTKSKSKPNIRNKGTMKSIVSNEDNNNMQSDYNHVSGSLTSTDRSDFDGHNKYLPVVDRYSSYSLCHAEPSPLSAYGNNSTNHYSGGGGGDDNVKHHPPISYNQSAGYNQRKEYQTPSDAYVEEYSSQLVIPNNQMDRIMQQFDTVINRMSLLENRMQRIETKLETVSSSNEQYRVPIPGIYTNHSGFNQSIEKTHNYNLPYTNKYDHLNTTNRLATDSKSNNNLQGTSNSRIHERTLSTPTTHETSAPNNEKFNSSRFYTSKYEPLLNGDLKNRENIISDFESNPNQRIQRPYSGGANGTSSTVTNGVMSDERSLSYTSNSYKPSMSSSSHQYTSSTMSQPSQHQQNHHNQQPLTKYSPHPINTSTTVPVASSTTSYQVTSKKPPISHDVNLNNNNNNNNNNNHNNYNYSSSVLTKNNKNQSISNKKEDNPNLQSQSQRIASILSSTKRMLELNSSKSPSENHSTEEEI